MKGRKPNIAALPGALDKYRNLILKIAKVLSELSQLPAKRMVLPPLSRSRSDYTRDLSKLLEDLYGLDALPRIERVAYGLLPLLCSQNYFPKLMPLTISDFQTTLALRAKVKELFSVDPSAPVAPNAPSESPAMPPKNYL
ncbi:MAG: hypothetical protein WA615_25150 [Bradyrhizobium sp.]|jgi:hypothetical protein|uniref:hypothetical protein n=1 Tax=Bradyrhizobium sp. TaxID=376 RepID=UPI003C7D87F7